MKATLKHQSTLLNQERLRKNVTSGAGQAWVTLESPTLLVPIWIIITHSKSNDNASQNPEICSHPVS